MFGLKNEKLIYMYSCFIHLQADRQTNGQTAMDLSYRFIDLVQSFNYLHASAFCAPSLASLRRLFQN